MPKYRKKPVVVEARRVTSAALTRIAKWCGGEVFFYCGGSPTAAPSIGPPYISIRTPEGTMQAKMGDYVIRGVKGEFYPCQVDIFEMTYERLEPDRAD